MLQVPNRGRETLEPEIVYHVLRGSTIYTDGHRAYWNLNRVGYRHSMVNHTLHFVDPLTGVHTNTIEGLWSEVKRFFRKHGGINHGNLQDYLDEFTFRYMFCCDPDTRFFVIGKVVAKYWNDVV